MIGLAGLAVWKGDERQLWETSLRILSNFLQYGVITLLIVVEWPESVRYFYELFNTLGIGFNVFHPECAIRWTYFHTVRMSCFVSVR